ncbi:hypothetical protein KDL01_11685 [Actinospica durhamensis]|uniref:Uncharacterized protein n=1 Tax=Actinospica durhamensis TaxID=1508375 RepID=A0A941ENZ5_9ACTN|nr:hypothetical protein [Actinospica durhamensis]MBR7833932.1 hypothetical protein [Actinospica durhamensis]
MRVSRAVSLSMLTLGLTVGGISVAAADSDTRGASSTTASGVTSSFTHSTDDSFAAGSNSTSAAGVADTRAEAGVARDGASYDRIATTHVTDAGITHTGNFEAAGPRQRGDDEWRGEDSDHNRHGDCDRRRDHRGEDGEFGEHEHGGLLTDVVEDLL